MKVFIVLALVAAATAVPMQASLPERVQVVHAPVPAQSGAFERIQVVGNPIFDAQEPVANDADLAVKFVEAPADKMSAHAAIELPAAPLPPVNVQEIAPEPEVDGHFFAPIDEAIAAFDSNEKQTDLDIDQIKFVESPADDVLTANVETAMDYVQVVSNIAPETINNDIAPEAVRVVESPVQESFQKIAPSELESLRVVRPSPMEMAREAVQVVV